MKKTNQIKILSYILASTLLLSGCEKKSECNLPTRHVHKYIKQATEDISIEAYFDDEHLEILEPGDNYHWTQDYIEINKQDEKLYRTLRGLFDGVTNWNYLFYRMANAHDYLEFYYEYDTEEVRTRTTSDGKKEKYTETVHHSGWHYNASDSNNTGRTRLCHHRFYGYIVVLQNGKYQLIKSPLVDDFRYIIDTYPYYSEYCTEVVTKEFKFNKYELRYLSPDDFNVFEGPNLTTKDIHIKKRTN